MIDIPEPTIEAEIKRMLQEDLPEVLLNIEEESSESLRLPAFRYVGPIDEMPRGTGLPYALVEVVEGEYSVKDRIVKNRVLTAMVGVYCERKRALRLYYAGIEAVMDGRRFRVVKKSVDGGVEIRVKE